MVSRPEAKKGDFFIVCVRMDGWMDGRYRFFRPRFKKTIFLSTITILDHTLYGKVKKKINFDCVLYISMNIKYFLFVISFKNKLKNL